MMQSALICAALAAALMPMAASAQDKVVIDMIGVRLEAPLPTGYCPPDDAMQAVDDLMAAADTQNVTHVALRRCDATLHDEEAQKDYYLIKSPRTALAASITREALLAEMTQYFGKADWQAGGAMIKEITEKTNRELSETLSAPTEVKGEFGGRGTDADCAYIGGEAVVSLGELSYPIQAGACITSVGNKVLTVYAYGAPRDGGVVRLMQNARSLAMAFKATPLVSPSAAAPPKRP